MYAMLRRDISTHMTSNMGENLGLETKFANRLAILSALFTSGRRSEFDVVDTKIIECSGDFDFGREVKEGVPGVDH